MELSWKPNSASNWELHVSHWVQVKSSSRRNVYCMCLMQIKMRGGEYNEESCSVLGAQPALNLRVLRESDGRWRFVGPNNHQKVRLSVYQFSSAHTFFCGHRIHAAEETTMKKNKQLKQFLSDKELGNQKGVWRRSPTPWLTDKISYWHWILQELWNNWSPNEEHYISGGKKMLFSLQLFSYTWTFLPNRVQHPQQTIYLWQLWHCPLTENMGSPLSAKPLLFFPAWAPSLHTPNPESYFCGLAKWLT